MAVSRSLEFCAGDWMKEHQKLLPESPTPSATKTSDVRVQNSHRHHSDLNLKSMKHIPSTNTKPWEGVRKPPHHKPRGNERGKEGVGTHADTRCTTTRVCES